MTPTAIALLQAAAEPAAAVPVPPSATLLWAAVAAVGAWGGKLLYDLAMRQPPPPPPKPGGEGGKGAEDVLTALARIEDKVRDVRDLVHRLDDLHQVRRGDGQPVWYCAGGGMDARLQHLEALVRQLIEQQKQGNGLVSKLARRLREHLQTRGR